MKKYLIYAVLAACILGIASCSEDCDHPDFTGNGNVIVAFSLSDGNSEHELTIYQDSLVFYAPHDFNFANANVVFEISEGAAISPNPESLEDWSENTDFTVTAANGTNSRKYSYKVHIAKYEKEYAEVANLKTQAEVDEFGKMGYTKVKGLVINSSEDENEKITDLSSLNTIEEIEHNLQIVNFYGKSFSGFDKLKRVTTFNIKNDTIESLHFPELEYATNFLIGMLNDDVSVGFSSQSLENISCPKLKTISNNFVVSSRIQNFEGFSNLSEIGGDVRLYGRFENLKGLEKLTSLDYLTLQGMYLTSLEGLENLKTVRKVLEITYCQNLESLQGLNVENVGSLLITGCLRLVDITALSKVTELDQLRIRGEMFLESLEGLHNLKAVKGNLTLSNVGVRNYSGGEHAGISDLNGLRSLERIEGNLKIQDCYKLRTLDGLEKLTKLEGFLNVDYCEELINLNGIQNLTEIGPAIAIRYCTQLADYSGLAGIASSFYGDWIVGRNKYNPTWEEFQEGKYTEN